MNYQVVVSGICNNIIYKHILKCSKNNMYKDIEYITVKTEEKVVLSFNDHSTAYFFWSDLMDMITEAEADIELRFTY